MHAVRCVRASTFVCSLGGVVLYCAQPVARPEGVAYDKKDGEEIIKLPARPPIVVMAVRCAPPHF